MKLIELTKGKSAIVDDEDYEWLSRKKWHAIKVRHNWYAVGKIKKKHVYMHRFIMKTPPTLTTDHKNRNGLDNRKENLRNATNAQNNANKPVRSSKKTSRYKGVHYEKRYHIWFASCARKQKCCKSEVDAALAYNSMATEKYGEFSYLNVGHDENEG